MNSYNEIKRAKTACRVAAYKASRKYNVEIVISYDEGQSSYTYMNGENKYHIHIGFGLPRQIEDKIPLETCILALFYHELGHVIHTDFEGLPDFTKLQNEAYVKVPELASELIPAIRDGRILNETLLNEEEKKTYEEIIKTVSDYIFQSKRMSILNSFEDGAVENYVCMMHPESYIYISKLRNIIVQMEMQQNKEKYKTAITEKNVADYILDSLIMEIRAYSTLYYRRKNIRFSFLSKKGIDEYLGKYGFSQKTIKKLKELGMYSRFNAETTLHRLACSDTALECLMPLIEQKAKEFTSMYFEELSMDNSMTGEDFANMLGADCAEEFAVERRINSPSGGTAKTEPTYKMRAPKELDEEIQNKIDEYEKEKNDTSSENNSSNKGNSREENNRNNNSENGENFSNNENSNVDDKEFYSEENNGEKNPNSKTSDNVENSSSDNKTSSEENDEKEGDKTEESASSKTRELSPNEIIEEENKKDEKENKSYEKKLEKMMNKKIKEANESTINNVAKNMEAGKKPSIDGNGEIVSHSNVQCNFHKYNHQDDIDSHNLKNLPLLRSYAAKIAEPLKKILVYDAKSTIEKGLKNGKISLSNLYRSTTDLRCFQNKTEGKVKNAYISVLIDQSGSMSGEQIILAREAAYLLAEACRRTGVKISVNGHNTGINNTVEYYQYCDFSNCNKLLQIKQILSAEAGGANRDGYAIYLSDAYLYKNAPQDALKISIVISDGAPMANGYCGQSAVDDIRTINKMFERKGIQTIGIGIGYDTDSVKEIYDNHVIVPDVKTLGNELIKILKNIIK